MPLVTSPLTVFLKYGQLYFSKVSDGIAGYLTSLFLELKHIFDAQKYYFINNAEIITPTKSSGKRCLSSFVHAEKSQMFCSSFNALKIISLFGQDNGTMGIPTSFTFLSNPWSMDWRWAGVKMFGKSDMSRSAEWIPVRE